MDNELMAKRIKLSCKKNKVTIKKLLEDINLNKNFLFDVENRGVKPSVEAVESIADYLNVSIDYIVGRTDNSEINR